MPKIHKESLNKNILTYLYLSTFLLGLASAFILYLESDYFKEAVKSENVTPFYIIAYGAALILMLNWHHLVRLYGKSRVFQFSLLVKLALSFLLALLPLSLWSVWLLIVYITFTVINWLDMDILLETCSVDKKTGKIRGTYLTIENAGYLAAPLFSGYLVNKYGFQASFAFSFFILFIVFVIASAKIKDVNECPLKKDNFLSLLRRLYFRKNILKAYYVSFLLEFFYALMIIFTPLYLLNLGFNWLQIGKIFTFMLIPFVLFQYPAGYLADKKFEERDMMAAALAILGTSTAAIYFIDSHSIVLWAGILFCTRIGASLIEVLRDSYFYKRVDQTDVDITDFFRTVRPAAYIIGSLIAAPIIFFLGIRVIFVIIGIAVLTGIPVCLRLASSRIPPKINKNIHC